MKRQVLYSCLSVTLLLLPRAAVAQEQPAAAKPAEQNTRASSAPTAPGAEAAKPAGEPKEVVKSAAFADVDLDGQLDIVLAYEFAPEDVAVQATDVASYIELVGRIDDGGIGASLSPVSDTLQAQLKLAKGQGLVVTKVNADSPAAKAGLQVDDILLSAGDRPLAKPSDVSDVVGSPVKKPFTVEFTVLRGGERRNVSLTVTDSAAGRLLRLAVRSVSEPSYRIGVEVSDASSTLRAQLKLPKDQGIVIDRVLPDSPAQKAGFKEHDMLVTVDGKPLTKSEDLSAAVKASEGKSLKFSLLRGGQRSEIAVTPEKHNEQAYRVRTRAFARHTLLDVQLANQARERAVLTDWIVRQPKPEGDTAAQIERMLKQIDDLRESVKALQGTVARQKSAVKPTPKTDLPIKSDQPKN